MLNTLPPWAGMTILLLADIVVLALMRAHDQRQMNRLLRSEKKRLAEWAEVRADQLAEAKFTDMVIEEKLRRGR